MPNPTQRLSRTTLASLLVFGTVQAGCIAISPELDMNLAPNGHQFDRVRVAGFQHEGRLQEILRRGVVATGIAAEVDNGASLRVEGRLVHAGPSTTNGEVAWNVVNTVTLLFLIGGPYLGSAEATVELRLFDRDQLLVTQTSTATANWRAHYEVLPRVIDSRKRALRRAQELAVWQAAEGLSTTAWP